MRRLEQIAQSLETDEKILDAIETVTGELFESDNIGEYDPLTDGILENSAYELWEEGDRQDEILAALPTDNADEGDTICWGTDGTFAEFDGEKWIKNV